MSAQSVLVCENNPLTEQSSNDEYKDLPEAQSMVLLLSIMVVALCGIVYELIIGTVSSYLLGNSVYQFSLTIGFFMFAMGIGSFLSRYILNHLIQAFVYVELILALVGGICSIALFMVFPYAPWLYQTIMLAFILMIGILVGLEIPLLTRVLAARKGTRRSIADVMSLDYIGALVGSVAFPLFLLPSLGLITASFAIGLINCLVALVNVVWLRDHLKAPRIALAAVFGVLALLFFLTIMAGRITAFAQQHLYFDQIVWQKQTQYQSLVATLDWPKRDLRLYIDGHLQFSELDEHRYHEALVHPIMSRTGNRETVLVLGGGDGLAVREVLKYDGVKRIDLVDIDPEMTRLGTEFAPLLKLNGDSLNDPRVHVHNIDAFLYVRQTDKVYDRVIIDFPDPHNEAISKLYSVEFYTMVRARMTDNAYLVSQSSSPFFARKTFWTIATTLEDVFEHTSHYAIGIPAFGIWGFNIAQMKPGVAGQAYPNDLRFMSAEVFNASLVFSRDIQRPEGLSANSIFEPELYSVYLEDLKS